MDGRISNFQQVASIRRYTLTEGGEKGLDVLDCDNGKIRFLLNVGKACDIMQLYHEGQNMSFVSKNGFIKREISFLKRFEGGMLYTCGLDSIGGRDGYELHGTLHNIPAEIIGAKQMLQRRRCKTAENLFRGRWLPFLQTERALTKRTAGL